MHAADQFTESWTAREISAYCQTVDKTTDESLDLYPVAIRNRYAHHDVFLHRVAAKKGVEGREQRHEEGRAFSTAQIIQRLSQVCRKQRRLTGTRVRLHSRSRAVGWQPQSGDTL